MDIKKNNRIWAIKQMIKFFGSFKYLNCKFDGKTTVVSYMDPKGIIYRGVAHYIEGDQRSDVVAGDLADSRAQLSMVEDLICKLKSSKDISDMFYSQKNEKLETLLLRARIVKNRIKKHIRACQKSLNFETK